MTDQQQSSNTEINESTAGTYLLEGKRIVIKYGTNALTKADENGKYALDRDKISGIAKIVNTLYNNGKEPIVVSSAAVVEGMNMLGWASRPPASEVKKLQLASSVGQAPLAEAYNAELAHFNLVAAQILPVHYNFETDEERRNISDIVNMSFQHRAIPLFNTNDPLTNEELIPVNSLYTFTDNDPLAALIAINCSANSLIIVSENGDLGKGGSSSKKDALQRAEEAGIHSNLNYPLTHARLERMMEIYFQG